jgi:hypothetical protein
MPHKGLSMSVDLPRATVGLLAPTTFQAHLMVFLDASDRFPTYEV